MFDSLNQPVAWAGDLFRGVAREETLGIFPNKNVDCGGAVKSVASRENLSLFVSSGGVVWLASAAAGFLVGAGGARGSS